MDEEFYQGLKKQLDGLDVSLLVNNAGVTYFKFFENVKQRS